MFFGQRPKPQTNIPVTVAAPVGGLNAFDSLTAMPEQDAITLQNWWPQPFGVAMRKGYVEWSTGLPSTVETLATWSNKLGGTKLFAWSDANMYDASTRGVIGAPIVTLLTNARWEWINVTNDSGSHLIAVNGFDDAIHYQDSGVSRITAGDGIVPDTWAGLNPASAVSVCVHQRRLWAIEKNSSKGWYLPPDAIQGTFVDFDFGPQFSRGGFLQLLTTWTIDDGNGATDFLVAVSSLGEAVVYSGTDPSDDTKWSLVGIYYIGSPVSGFRCFAKVGADLAILTDQGVVSMSAQLTSTKVKEKTDGVLSKKIQFLLAELTTTFSSVFGWSLQYFPPINMLLIAVPSVTAGGNVQLASNQIIQSWTQFEGMDAAAWVLHNKSPYFGDYDGRILLAWTGNSDNVLLDNTGGEGITAIVQQAYSYLQGKGGQNRSNQKQVGLYRPVFVTGGSIGFNSQIVYDYENRSLTTPSAIPIPSGSLWGVGLWGSAFWSGALNVTQDWEQAEGMGAAASLKMVVLSASEVLWVSTDYSLVQGSGIL